MKRAGDHVAEQRAVPSQQRLETGEPAVGGGELRLVVERQLPCRGRYAQEPAHRDAILDVLHVFGQEGADAIPAQALAALGCRLRPAQEIQGRAAMRRRTTHSDRGGQQHAIVVAIEGHGERIANAFGEHLGRRTVAAMLDDDELVARKMTDGDVLARQRLQAGADRPQHLVAQRVADGLVDAMKAIEVDEHHRDECTGVRQHVDQARLEHGVAIEPGHDVVPGMVGHRRGQSSLLGQVADECREVRRGLVVAARHGQFDGKGLATGTDGDEFQSPIEQRGLAGREVPQETLAMTIAQIGRNDDFGDVQSHYLRALPAEHALGGRIEFPDVPELVDDDDGIERRLHDRAIPRFALDERSPHSGPSHHAFSVPLGTGSARCRAPSQTPIRLSV